MGGGLGSGGIGDISDLKHERGCTCESLHVLRLLEEWRLEREEKAKFCIRRRSRETEERVLVKPGREIINEYIYIYIKMILKNEILIINKIISLNFF